LIKTDAKYAYWYARDVIKDRWMEAEEVIKLSACFWTAYSHRFEIQLADVVSSEQ